MPPSLVAALIAAVLLSPGFVALVAVVLEDQRAPDVRTAVRARRAHRRGDQIRARRDAARRIARQLRQPAPYPPLRPAVHRAHTGGGPGTVLTIRARIAGEQSPAGGQLETGGQRIADASPVSSPRTVAA